VNPGGCLEIGLKNPDGDIMAQILWITHRDISFDLTRTSRLGISSELEKRGHSISWMAPSKEVEHFVFRSSRLGFGHTTFTRSIRNCIQEIPLPEIAIVEWTGVEGSYQELHKRSIPWILMDRSPPTSRGFAGIIQRRQYRKAWRISKQFSIGAAVKSKFHIDPSGNIPYVVVPGGVDCSRFNHKRSIRQSPELVYHGSITKVRELHRLIRMGLNVRFIGSGDAVNQLRSIGAHVDGPYTLEEVSIALSEGDIGLLHLPNRIEWRGASPLKVSEYAASGMCVVSSDVSGLSEYCDEEWLTLVPLGDDLKFLNAINNLLECGMDEIRRRGELARKWALQNRDWSVCIQDLEKLINDSLNL
jgi:glycosyltransferase involved in cell wall biosynthesis